MASQFTCFHNYINHGCPHLCKENKYGTSSPLFFSGEWYPESNGSFPFIGHFFFYGLSMKYYGFKS